MHTPYRGHGGLGASLPGPEHVRSRQSGFFLHLFLLIHSIADIVSLQCVASPSWKKDRCPIVHLKLDLSRKIPVLSWGHPTGQFPLQGQSHFILLPAPGGGSYFYHNTLIYNLHLRFTGKETNDQKHHSAMNNNYLFLTACQSPLFSVLCM